MTEQETHFTDDEKTQLRQAEKLIMKLCFASKTREKISHMRTLINNITYNASNTLTEKDEGLEDSEELLALREMKKKYDALKEILKD